MTEYAHNEAYPFAIVGNLSESVVGLMASKALAEAAAEALGRSNYFVVDTTPKPKIPADASVISWYDSSICMPRVAARVGHPGNGVWVVSSMLGRYTTNEILDSIGSADVKVLETFNES